MKATTTLACVSLTVLLAGCGNAVRITEAPQDCPVTSTSMSLEYGTGRLALDTECIKVSSGATVTLHLEPTPTAAGAVRTKFRGLGNRWLDEESAAGADTITMQVPQKTERRYKFEIHVRGVGVLDPRIVIP